MNKIVTVNEKLPFDVYDPIPIHALYLHYADYMNPCLQIECDYDSCDIVVSYEREETEKEIEKRMAMEAKQLAEKEKAKEKRRIKYLQMKKEFEDE
jgi:hypothetical protein